MDGLKTVVMIVTEDDCGIKPPQKLVFPLSSLSSNAEKFGLAIRSPWTLKRAYIGRLMLHFLNIKAGFGNRTIPKTLHFYVASAINLLKQEKTSKQSLKMKRYRAAMDNNYLVKILNSAS